MTNIQTEIKHRLEQLLKGETAAKTVLFLPNDLASLKTFNKSLLEKLSAAAKINEFTLYGIRLSIWEALVNAYKHGNQEDKGKQVEVGFEVENTHLFISIKDQGGGYGTRGKPEEPFRESGWGLEIIEIYMDHVAITPAGNEIRMVKVLS